MASKVRPSRGKKLEVPRPLKSSSSDITELPKDDQLEFYPALVLMDDLLKTEKIEGIDTDLLTQCVNALILAGKTIDNNHPECLDKLYETIRTALINPTLGPQPRTQLLQLLELRSCGWELGPSQEDYYNKKLSEMKIRQPGSGEEELELETGEENSTESSNTELKSDAEPVETIIETSHIKEASVTEAENEPLTQGEEQQREAIIDEIEEKSALKALDVYGSPGEEDSVIDMQFDDDDQSMNSEEITDDICLEETVVLDCSPDKDGSATEVEMKDNQNSNSAQETDDTGLEQPLQLEQPMELEQPLELDNAFVEDKGESDGKVDMKNQAVSEELVNDKTVEDSVKIKENGLILEKLSIDLINPLTARLPDTEDESSLNSPSLDSLEIITEKFECLHLSEAKQVIGSDPATNRIENVFNKSDLDINEQEQTVIEIKEDISLVENVDSNKSSEIETTDDKMVQSSSKIEKVLVTSPKPLNPVENVETAKAVNDEQFQVNETVDPNKPSDNIEETVKNIPVEITKENIKSGVPEVTKNSIETTTINEGEDKPTIEKIEAMPGENSGILNSIENTPEEITFKKEPVDTEEQESSTEFESIDIIIHEDVNMKIVESGSTAELREYVTLEINENGSGLVHAEEQLDEHSEHPRVIEITPEEVTMKIEFVDTETSESMIEFEPVKTEAATENPVVPKIEELDDKNSCEDMEGADKVITEKEVECESRQKNDSEKIECAIQLTKVEITEDLAVQNAGMPGETNNIIPKDMNMNAVESGITEKSETHEQLAEKPLVKNPGHLDVDIHMRGETVKNKLLSDESDTETSTIRSTKDREKELDQSLEHTDVIERIVKIVPKETSMINVTSSKTEAKSTVLKPPVSKAESRSDASEKNSAKVPEILHAGKPEINFPNKSENIPDECETKDIVQSCTGKRTVTNFSKSVLSKLERKVTIARPKKTQQPIYIESPFMALTEQIRAEAAHDEHIRKYFEEEKVTSAVDDALHGVRKRPITFINKEAFKKDPVTPADPLKTFAEHDHRFGEPSWGPDVPYPEHRNLCRRRQEPRKVDQCNSLYTEPRKVYEHHSLYTGPQNMDTTITMYADYASDPRKMVEVIDVYRDMLIFSVRAEIAQVFITSKKATGFIAMMTDTNIKTISCKDKDILMFKIQGPEKDRNKAMRLIMQRLVVPSQVQAKTLHNTTQYQRNHTIDAQRNLRKAALSGKDHNTGPKPVFYLGEQNKEMKEASLMRRTSEPAIKLNSLDKNQAVGTEENSRVYRRLHSDSTLTDRPAGLTNGNTVTPVRARGRGRGRSPTISPPELPRPGSSSISPTYKSPLDLVRSISDCSGDSNYHSAFSTPCGKNVNRSLSYPAEHSSNFSDVILEEMQEYNNSTNDNVFKSLDCNSNEVLSKSNLIKVQPAEESVENEEEFWGDDEENQLMEELNKMRIIPGNKVSRRRSVEKDMTHGDRVTSTPAVQSAGRPTSWAEWNTSRINKSTNEAGDGSLLNKGFMEKSGYLNKSDSSVSNSRLNYTHTEDRRRAYSGTAGQQEYTGFINKHDEQDTQNQETPRPRSKSLGRNLFPEPDNETLRDKQRNGFGRRSSADADVNQSQGFHEGIQGDRNRSMDREEGYRPRSKKNLIEVHDGYAVRIKDRLGVIQPKNVIRAPLNPLSDSLEVMLIERAAPGGPLTASGRRRAFKQAEAKRKQEGDDGNKFSRFSGHRPSPHRRYSREFLLQRSKSTLCKKPPPEFSFIAKIFDICFLQNEKPFDPDEYHFEPGPPLPPTVTIEDTAEKENWS